MKKYIISDDPLEAAFLGMGGTVLLAYAITGLDALFGQKEERVQNVSPPKTLQIDRPADLDDLLYFV